ncbi:DUF6311 domain-containing protein [Variovorax robiniae]|uniref:DUF6311 domain-containing protein n=1 Tax=Variovorax robiniae TaxID=1836199 RepID=A0ABU8X7T0_9BURK
MNLLLRKCFNSNLAPIAFGLCAFLLVVGPRVLNVQNVAWLSSGDPAAHYLGWAFFRKSPWTFPIGLNPSYGLELSSSIVYSDSNPLLAFLFKPFDLILPATFQYFGFWLLACFLLQAWFGWKIAGLFCESTNARLAATGLFVFSPPMMWRLNGHLNLVAHFQILAALYLTLARSLPSRPAKWIALLAVAALTHSYLLAMVGALWFFNLLQRVFDRVTPLRSAGLEFVIAVAVTLLVAWQAGYFVVSNDLAAGGFGYYRMNLLALLDPSGWSYVLKDIPESPGEYEGFNYLGLGVILLGVFAIPVLLKTPTLLSAKILRFRFLFIVFVLLSLFAISHNIGIASKEFDIPMPDWFLRIAGIFRSSGRMYWPVFYGILMAMVYFVVRGYPTVGTRLLIIAIILQIVDAHSAYSKIRANLMIPASRLVDSSLTNSDLNLAATHRLKARWIQPSNVSENWKTIASFAVTNGLSTDAVYLARVSSVALAEARSNAQRILTYGLFERDSIYFFDETSFRSILIRGPRPTDLLTNVGGLHVLVPGWKECRLCPNLGEEAALPRWTPGKRMLTNDGGEGSNYLGSGWSNPEKWGNWSDGSTAELIIPLGDRIPESLTIEWFAFVSKAHPKQSVEVVIGGMSIRKFEVTSPDRNIVEIEIPRSAIDSNGYDRRLPVQFKLSNSVSPLALGISDDSRNLGIGILALTVH